MSNKIIFDVGMGDGENTKYFLLKGFIVIGIDANPAVIQNMRKKFSNFVENKFLILLNFAVSNTHKRSVPFYISENLAWSSLDEDISTRLDENSKKILIPQKKLSTIMKKFGVPYYCKIDVEGADLECLHSLEELGELPTFISAESECLRKNEEISNLEASAVLNALHMLGYNRFKLVNQNSNVVLQQNVPFYRQPSWLTLLYAFISKKETFVVKPSKKNEYCFGEDLKYEWCDFETAKKLLFFHRNAYFKLKSQYNFGFWCDWHAKKI